MKKKRYPKQNKYKQENYVKKWQTAGRQRVCVGEEKAEPRLSCVAQEFPLTRVESWRRRRRRSCCFVFKKKKKHLCVKRVRRKETRTGRVCIKSVV